MGQKGNRLGFLFTLTLLEKFDINIAVSCYWGEEMIECHNIGRSFILGLLLCIGIILLGSYDAYCLEVPQSPAEICDEEALERDDCKEDAAQGYSTILCFSPSIFTHFTVGFWVYTPLPNFFCKYLSKNFQDRSPPA